MRKQNWRRLRRPQRRVDPGPGRGQAEHGPSPHPVGIIRVKDQDGGLDRRIKEFEPEPESFRLPAVLIVIVLLALIYIAAVTCFIARMPVGSAK
jgi:hypothetical protein